MGCLRHSLVDDMAPNSLKSPSSTQHRVNTFAFLPSSIGGVRFCCTFALLLLREKEKGQQPAYNVPQPNGGAQKTCWDTNVTNDLTLRVGLAQVNRSRHVSKCFPSSAAHPEGDVYFVHISVAAGVNTLPLPVTCTEDSIHGSSQGKFDRTCLQVAVLQML